MNVTPVLADVILPAFWVPYVLSLFPVAVIAIFISEFIVYRLRHRGIGSWIIALHVFLSNVLSFFFGLYITYFLPWGYDRENWPNELPDYGFLSYVAFPVACLLSWLIEYFYFRWFVPREARSKLFWSCLYANLASYTLLIGVVMLFSILM